MIGFSGTWLWINGFGGFGSWLAHLPTGATIRINPNRYPIVVVLEWGDEIKTHLYHSKTLDDAKEYLLVLGKTLGALDIAKTRMQQADLALALGIAKKHFPDAGEIVSDMYHDPENGESYPIVYVRLAEYDDNFLERLKAARKEALKAVEGRVSITTDYRRG